jgi:hypothetical protein
MLELNFSKDTDQISGQEMEDYDKQMEEAKRVPYGCLSPEMTEALHDVVSGKAKHQVKVSHQICYLLFYIFVGPSIVGGLNSIPFAAPYGNDFASHAHFYFVYVPLGVSFNGPGLALLLLVLLNIRHTDRLRVVVRFTLAFVTSYTVTSALAGFLWRTPLPIGFVWVGFISFFFAIGVLLYDTFGWKKFQTGSGSWDWEHIKRVCWQLIPAVLSFAFVFVFVLYRFLFTNMGPRGQFFLAPLWPIIKMVFKNATKQALARGHNPDAGPLGAFFFDQLGQVLPPHPFTISLV